MSSERVRKMQKQVERGIINTRQAVQAAAANGWTDSEIKALKAALNEKIIFEPGAEDSLAAARRALDSAYAAYAKCRGQGKLDQEVGDLREALAQLQVARREMEDFYNISGVEFPEEV